MEIVNVMASSIDGLIGAAKIESDSERIALGLSSNVDRKFLRAEISKADAVIVGAGSIRANRSCLDWHGANGRAPDWFILANHPLDHAYDFWKQSHIGRILVTKETHSLPQASGVENIVYGNREPEVFLCQYLQSKGYKRVLLFGGGVVNAMFYQQNMVNRLHISISPILIGRSDAPRLISGELSVPIKMELESLEFEDNFVFLYYVISR